jgi:hypothetical protein
MVCCSQKILQCRGFLQVIGLLVVVARVVNAKEVRKQRRGRLLACHKYRREKENLEGGVLMSHYVFFIHNL